MSYSKQTWNDGVSGGTPITAAGLQHIEAGIFNADFLTCTSTTRPTTGLFDGMRIYETDTKAFGLYDLTNTAWHMFDTVSQGFFPTLTTVGGAPAVGNATFQGYYKRMGKHCWLRIYLNVGSTTNGGTGNAQFNIPSVIAAYNGQEQWIPAKIWAGAQSNFAGLAFIQGTSVLPYFPGNASSSILAPLASANASGASGTGTPSMPGAFTLSSGSNVTVEGVYELTTG